MKIVFMGTPDFAVPSLEKLINPSCEVALIITQPDRPKGRSRKITPPPIKKAAMEHNIPVIQPENVNESEVVTTLKDMKPDIIVVVAYGQILTKRILNIPSLGCVNVHASLLPKYRGAAPIQWAIINGEKETGVTTMLMDEGMDTGDILLKKAIQIKRDDTAASLHDKLALLGADLLLETVEKMKKGEVVPKPQDHGKASYAPMLKKQDGQIDWTKSSEDVNNLIRGCYPWPGAFTFYNGKRIKIIKSQVIDANSICTYPGKVVEIQNDGFVVECGKGKILIRRVQPSGSKQMHARDFVNGYKLKRGYILGNRG